ncbi:hypothetical protein MT389_20370 [Aeromonas salmonicida]|uniref:hypothetical protein n=1 Tax=Aeromonas salmonicida TaxID=645 RepID=UPI00111B2325|nr:hypothetical protein [Aeromonas salmonicida]
MMRVLSRCTGGLIPEYRLGSQVSEGPVSNHRLKENLDGRFEKLRNRGKPPTICYELAIHAARAGNAITKEAEKALVNAKGYSTEYLSLMNIFPSGKRSCFYSERINESGFLNFENRDGDVVHTAYIHRTSEGALVLVHNNSLPLDKELSKIIGLPEYRGRTNVYDLMSCCDAAINKYMDSEGLSFHYTPASKVNEKF